MSEPVRGTIEVKWGEGPDAENRGLVVAGASPDTVPLILQSVYGFTDVGEADPVNGESSADGVWTATDERQRPVRVLLHRDPDIDETLIGQVITQMIAVQAQAEQEEA